MGGSNSTSRSLGCIAAASRKTVYDDLFTECVVNGISDSIKAPPSYLQILTLTRRAIAPDVEQATTRQSRLATRRRVVVV